MQPPPPRGHLSCHVTWKPVTDNSTRCFSFATFLHILHAHVSEIQETMEKETVLEKSISESSLIRYTGQASGHSGRHEFPPPRKGTWKRYLILQVSTFPISLFFSMYLTFYLLQTVRLPGLFNIDLEVFWAELPDLNEMSMIRIFPNRSVCGEACTTKGALPSITKREIEGLTEYRVVKSARR